MAVLAETSDPARVCTALRALSRDLADPYLMPDAVVARALAAGIAGAVLAEEGDVPVGVALYSLFLSTTRGRVGAFVTDLWVDQGQRGTGLGRRMLARVRDRTAADWGGTFLRLNYAGDNPGATAFYARLGFAPKPQEIWVTLEGAELEGLA